MAIEAKYRRYNGSSWDEITFPPSSHTHTNADLTGLASWAKAASKPTYTASEVGAMPTSPVLMPTNPFGGRKIYINYLDNAFASADKKYYVTITKHKRVDNGVEYPYINSSKSVTDNDYYVDGPVISTHNDLIHSIFDGSYEGGVSCSNNEYIKVRIKFGPQESLASARAFPGYPYGYYYLSYYYTGTPYKASQCRVYNTYSTHTLGWKVYNAEAYNGSIESNKENYIEKFTVSGDYQRTCVEFIIYGRLNSRYNTTLTQIDYQLTRPDLSQDGSTVTKYGDQVLYSKFTWKSNKEDKIIINPDNGVVTATSFTENGTTLANKYQAKGNYYTKTETDSAISTAISDAITNVLNTAI